MMAETTLEFVDRPPLASASGGRPAAGWCGGKAVIQTLISDKRRKWLRMRLTVPYDKARSGIYRAASLAGVRIAIVRNDEHLFVRRD